jgi:hypothetical protein
VSTDSDDARRHLQQVVRDALADDRERERADDDPEPPRDERRDQLDAVREQMRRQDAERD